MHTHPNTTYSSTGGWRASAPGLAVPVGVLDHTNGDPDAPVTLVQYGAYDCASCVDAQPIVRAVLQRHGRRMRYVFRHFPQNSRNPQPSLAAQAAEAAGAQGRFWEMHDLLLRNRGNLAEAELTHLALATGLEIYRFTADLAGGEHERRIRADFLGGLQSGVPRTPTFFLNGVRLAGHRSVEVLSAAVEWAIRPARACADRTSYANAAGRDLRSPVSSTA